MGGNTGDEMLPSYVGMFQRKHEIRIPKLNNQDSIASKTGFVVAQIVIQTVKAVFIVIQTVKPNKTNDNCH